MATDVLATIIGMLEARKPEQLPAVSVLRAELEALVAALPSSEDVEREPMRIGVQGDLAAEWLRTPRMRDETALLYLHGGGYVMGSIETHRELAANVGRASGMKVLMVDYRLAPEHPHPAAVEDATAAYKWLLAEGYEPAHIAIAGDSAGGGLAIASLVSLRDEGVILPAAAVCFSPWVDLEGVGASMRTRAEQDPMISPQFIREVGAMYLGGADPRSPLAAPLYADLRGLPPLLVQVGTREILLDDATRIVSRARAAGVDAHLETFKGMFHVFQAFASVLPEAKAALASVGQFLRPST